MSLTLTMTEGIDRPMNIPKYGGPDRYLIVDGIPKSIMGKSNKIQLRKLYG